MANDCTERHSVVRKRKHMRGRIRKGKRGKKHRKREKSEGSKVNFI